MTAKQEKNAGFTILEVLITLAILSIVLMSATKLLTSNVKSVQAIDKNVEYTQNLRITTNQIMDRIKKDNNVKVEVIGNLLVIDNNPVLDTEKKETNANIAELWLYDKQDEDESAELRDRAGNVLAEYIKTINIVNQPNGDPYLNIVIYLIDDAEMKEAVLSVPKVLSFSSVIPNEPDPNAVWAGFLTYSSYLTVDNSALIHGPTSTVFIKNISSSDITIKNSAVIRALNIYANKDLELDNSASIGNVDGSSSIYVKGSVELKNSARFYGKLYYTGSYDGPPGNTIKVSSITFPAVSMPVPQPDAWYLARGFTSNTNPVNGMKYKGGSITFDSRYVSDVCVYSTGNIVIKNASTVSGILYAPNGSVILDNSATFRGVIIANEIIVKNSTRLYFEDFNTDDLPF